MKDKVIAIQSDQSSGIIKGQSYIVESNDLGRGVVAVRHLKTDTLTYCSPHLFDLSPVDYQEIYNDMTKEPEKVEGLTKVNLPHDPDHYKTGGIETIDYMRAKLTPEQMEGYLLGNIMKYLSRFGYKD